MTAKPDVELEGLSDVEATMDFTNPKEFTKTIQALCYNAHNRDPVADHSFLVRGYPKKYISIDDDEQPLFPGLRKALYFQDSQILLITVPGGPHEIAAARFCVYLYQKLGVMGCTEEFVTKGGQTASMGSVTKEPDESWGPFRAGTGPNYVTCVLESAMSESGRALTRDAKIWIENENSHVTNVIGVNIYRRRPEIIFTIWKRGRQERDTRAHHPVRAVVDQDIRITLQAGRPVAEGSLCLSFEEVFERQPQPGTAEGNINFSARELGAIARMVWSEMGYAIE
ncbi:hypothetical protein VE00_04932 [Pseudogymnoascus sp. WSF 3629]|nr:hypothetical protein VE00_04932 [Pseudogymnoascus sp. WSF 3629]